MTVRTKSNNRRGRFKLVIFFKQHRLARGFTLYSTAGQDVRGVSSDRFKHLVLQGKFAGKVKWAGIYEVGREVWRWSCFNV
ncbi:hypothetical protein CRP01_04675 [Flavilitoribacter nigricans DSM 23189 = NBRC 102662]|uniref:Uncharacterized protein n=1 Tax=Flavilitoribacter nigricans (strain ATCC 23147 / DSM 23189 / NBRC 102662 / NCIMB 1420 / SS-2) TaxID=1122177 RepID=A0A2D0NHG0_FLAN2|nr:hypothetical protein CRP01_04675 [Flavilitoribacter nigricans DSM 23189 = NBRC 102662]